MDELDLYSMIKYLLLLILLTSCESEDFITRAHVYSIRDKEYCYMIKEPKEIIGFYCLKYLGQNLPEGYHYKND